MGQQQSQTNVTDGSQNLEMVADKVKNLKCQGEKLAKALFLKVDELNDECRKALEASNNNSHVASMVAYRLDSFAELLDNAMLKLQSNETDPTQTNPGERVFASLSKRIDEVEASNAKLEKLGSDFQKAFKESTSSKQLKTNVEKLESQVNTMAGNIILLTHDVSEVQRKTIEVPTLQRKLETLSTDLDTCRREITGRKIKKIKSKLNLLKKQMGSIKDEKDTAVLVLFKKISNLEKIRDVLNKNHSAKLSLRQMCEDTNKQLMRLEDDIAWRNRPQVGFTAMLKQERRIDRNYPVNRLFDVIANNGDCFKPHQGHFITPYDGLYCFCVKIETRAGESGSFSASLMSKNVRDEGLIRLEIPMNHSSPHSALCILRLTANERIFVKFTRLDKPVTLCNTFTFSGWSIGYE